MVMGIKKRKHLRRSVQVMAPRLVTAPNNTCSSVVIQNICLKFLFISIFHGFLLWVSKQTLHSMVVQFQFSACQLFTKIYYLLMFFLGCRNEMSNQQHQFSFILCIISVYFKSFNFSLSCLLALVQYSTQKKIVMLLFDCVVYMQFCCLL